MLDVCGDAGELFDELDTLVAQRLQAIVAVRLELVAELGVTRLRLEVVPLA